MNKLNIAILALALSAATVDAMELSTVKRGRVSRAYHHAHDRLVDHKGKVGLAVGAVGTMLISRAFKEEIKGYVKPFIKSVFRKLGNFFRRVFKRPEKI